VSTKTKELDNYGEFLSSHFPPHPGGGGGQKRRTMSAGDWVDCAVVVLNDAATMVQQQQPSDNPNLNPNPNSKLDQAMWVEKMGATLTTIALVVGAAFPPGVAVAAVGDLMHVLSLFLDNSNQDVSTGTTTSSSTTTTTSSSSFNNPFSGLPPLTLSQVQAAVDKDIASYSTLVDISQYPGMAILFPLEVGHFTRFLSELSHIRNTKGGAEEEEAQGSVNSQIGKWHEVWEMVDWPVIQKSIMTVVHSYEEKVGSSSSSTKDGEESSSLRGKVKDWMSRCQMFCQMTEEKGGEMIMLGNTIMNECHEDATTTSMVWSQLQSFSAAFVSLAIKLSTMQWAITAIYQQASGCGGSRITDASSCPYSQIVLEMDEKVSQLARHAFYIKQSLQMMKDDCSSQWGWPFSQSCDREGDRCNYANVLVISPAVSE